ncbi:hypothetical protein JOQ06_030127, partial [Pogonophryne albipinna]
MKAKAPELWAPRCVCVPSQRLWSWAALPPTLGYGWRRVGGGVGGESGREEWEERVGGESGRREWEGEKVPEFTGQVDKPQSPRAAHSLQRKVPTELRVDEG